MRKLLWIVMGLLLLGGLGGLLDGRDEPVRASDGFTSGVSAPQFEGSLYVTASRLNLRESPSTSGRVLGTLTRNSVVQVGERQNGWVMVSLDGRQGWVSGNYLGVNPVVAAIRAPQRPAKVYSAPRQSQSRQPVAQRGNDASCPRRQYCTRIGSCAEARWYLANCSWGALLDSDSDGVPCESICR